MKTVYLLRHAKSDWGVPGLADHDRPLNERGQAAAPRMAAYIKAKRYKIGLVLCSSAQRTVETLALVKPSLGEPKVKIDEALYLAEAGRLLERLKHVDDKVESVMFIGHNPGMEQFAQALSTSPSTEAQEKLHRRMREKFSTCALAVITLPVKSWREAKPGFGTLEDFMRPKDL
jgi:phosphohistidine phosphatase